jgi:hypothetical protein
MILSRSFSGRTFSVLLISLLVISGCAHRNGSVAVTKPRVVANVRIAVYPLANLSGTRVPLKEIRQLLIEGLKEAGVDILREDELERYFTRHRIRYLRGLSAEETEWMKDETGTNAVLIMSVDQYSEIAFPKIALSARLVSTGQRPVILWADSTGLAGNDSPGILDIGMIYDPQELLNKAIRYLSKSLTDYLSGKEEEVKSAAWRASRRSETGEIGQVMYPEYGEHPGTFGPRSHYGAPVAERGRKLSVVIVPFLNKAGRGQAGDIVMLEFIRRLNETGKFSIIDPGVLRQVMLNKRIMMIDSISLADSEIVFTDLDADLLLTGTVSEYYDYEGSYGTPRVAFVVSVIERTGKRLVWTSYSQNTGEDAVYFFDWGRFNTAHAMASEMIRIVAEQLSSLQETGT